MTKHGHGRRGKRSGTYYSWAEMKTRCNNPASVVFPRYGGRGIVVCERWRLFDNFLADMGERPDGTTLDRINNEGHYEPGNCRWATRVEQARNTARNTLTYETVATAKELRATGMTIREIGERLNVKTPTLQAMFNGYTWAK